MIEENRLKEELLQYLNNVIELRNAFTMYKLIGLDINGTLDKINKYPYMFVTITNALEDSFIMQSYKMFSSSEKKSIKTMINLCKSNKRHFQDSQKLEHELDDFEKYLNSQQNIIKNINKIRNKLLAHSDRKYFKHPDQVLKESPIKNEEFESLIEETYSRVKKICAMLQPFMIIDWQEEMKNEWNDLIEKI